MFKSTTPARFGLFSAQRQRYLGPRLTWVEWAYDARLFDSTEEAHEFRRNVLVLDNTTSADRPGCYVVPISG